MVSKKVKEAMEQAKKLEKIPEPKDEDIVGIYADAKESIQRLQKMLKPQWFTEDTTDKLSKKKKKGL